jgi:hypothetical protein
VEHGELSASADKRDHGWFRVVPVAKGEAMLARGEFAEALALADRAAEVSARLGLHRGRIVALDVALRALEGLQRWNETLARAETVLAEAEQAGFHTRMWRILATRARARDATGDAAGARADRSAARVVLDGMAIRIKDAELRAEFESDPQVLEVRNA